MTMDNPASSGGDVSLNMGNGTAGDAEGGQYMQQELLDLGTLFLLVSLPRNSFTHRHSSLSPTDPQAQQVRAIEDIQKTLVQLGQMFSQFSVLVQRQGEQIERIDDQVRNSLSIYCLPRRLTVFSSLRWSKHNRISKRPKSSFLSITAAFLGTDPSL